MNVLGYTENGAIRVIFDGDENESTVPDDMGNRHRQMIAEWEAAGNTIPPYISPPPVTAPHTPSIVAQARMSIDADGNVGGIGGDTGFAGAFPLMDGYIYVQFTEDQGTDQYIVSPTPIGPYLCYVANGDQYSDSFALTCTDLTGTPATPECIPLLVSKVG